MANILSFVSGFSYLQMFCLFHLVQVVGRLAASSRCTECPIIWQIFLSILICKCSVCFIWHKAGIRQVYRGQRLSGKFFSGNYHFQMFCLYNAGIRQMYGGQRLSGNPTHVTPFSTSFHVKISF